MVVQTLRVRFSARDTTNRLLVVPQPLLFLGDGDWHFLAIAVFTDIGVVLSLVCAVHTSFLAVLARIAKAYLRHLEWRGAAPVTLLWKIAPWKMLSHVTVIVLSTLIRAVARRDAPLRERLSR